MIVAGAIGFRPTQPRPRPVSALTTERTRRAKNILGLPRRSIAKNVSNLLKQRTGSCKSRSLTILEPACRSESIYSPHRRNESYRKLRFENPDERGNPGHDAGPRQPAAN